MVWNGIIVDGNNRYRICREYNIPFAYIEMDFESEEKARLWIIRNQLSRRNLPDFVKSELVLPFEAELKAEAKKRQGQRNALLNIPQNSAECLKNKETREELAALAGVSRDSISKTKQILAEADEETKEKLRKGEMSINRAYTSLKEKTNTTPKRPDLLPGYGLVKDMPPMKEGAYVRPPDSVYDTPPIVVYGNMPADDMERRGIAEIAHVKSDMNECMAYCVRKVSDIMRDMTAASVNEQNIDTLKEIVTSTLVANKETILKVIDLPDDANVLPIRYLSDISFFFSVVPIEPVVKIMVVHVVPTRYKTLAGTAHPMIY